MVVYDCFSATMAKTIFSLAASIIKLIIFFLFFLNANADTVNKKYNHDEKGSIIFVFSTDKETKNKLLKICVAISIVGGSPGLNIL